MQRRDIHILSMQHGHFYQYMPWSASQWKLNPGQHIAIVSSLLFYHLDKMREEEWEIFNKNNGWSILVT
jgi:hypothetical protein